MHRTYHGLAVVGGDLVVHQAKSGAWKGSSQTLDQPLDLGVTPTVSRAAASAQALAPSKVTSDIAGQKVDGTTLVVDATTASPRLAWRVLTGGRQADGTPSRLATYVDASTGKVLRTEQEIVNVDGSGRTLYSGTVPLKVTQSGSTYSLKDPTRGGTYTTDLKNAEDSYVCQVFGSRLQGRHDLHQLDHDLRQRHHRPTARRWVPTRSTAATRPGTTSRTCTAATASSATGPAPTTAPTTARTT